MDKHRSQAVSLPAALMIAFISLGAFTGVAKLVAPDKHFGLTSFSFAKDGEDDNEGDSEDNNDDNDGDSQDKSSEKAKKDAEKQKKDAERQRETLKKASERSGSRVVENENEDDTADVNGDDAENDDDTAKVEDDTEHSGSSEGMYKDKNKTLEKLNEELAKAEEDILKQQAKGANVSVQLAALAAYKDQLNAVGGSFDANNLDAAKALAKQIKKEAHFLKKDAQDAEKVAKEMADVLKRFAKAEAKVAELEALGGDVTSLKNQLSVLRSDYAVLQSTIDSAPGTISRETVKALGKKVQRVKSLAESAIFALGGDDDGELAADHEDESDDIAEHLMDVAEVEDGDHTDVATKVRTVATSQKLAAQTVKTSLQNFERRSKVTKFFLGADQTASAQLTAEVNAMQSRAATLETSAAALTDPDMKQILLDQAAALKSEATKLATYLNSQNSDFSLFGWLFR
jgi:hypothetical protein